MLVSYHRVRKDGVRPLGRMAWRREFREPMVRVAAATPDQITAWRIRDSLASHPVLGGGTANIRVLADYNHVVLEGWAMDATVHDLALKIASRSAGRRAVSTRVVVQNCRNLCTVARGL